LIYSKLSLKTEPHQVRFRFFYASPLGISKSRIPFLKKEILGKTGEKTHFPVTGALTRDY